MDTVSNLELEFHRVGGIEGVLNLMRMPNGGNAVAEPVHQRIKLGAALLSCWIYTAAGSEPNFCEDRSVSFAKDVVGIKPRDADAAREMSLGAKTLALVVQCVQGHTSADTRSNLLTVVAALGYHIREAGVAASLLNIISDGIESRDAQCCGEVSRALAAGLHGSRVLCQQLATTKWVQTWLALAFPEHILPPSSSVDETALREETRCCVERSVHKNKGNLETRENALSCLCSVTQFSDCAAQLLCELGGVDTLLLLSLGDEDYSKGAYGERPLAGNPTHHGIPTMRPFTRPGMLTVSSSADTNESSMTTGALPRSTSTYCYQWRKGPDPDPRTRHVVHGVAIYSYPFVDGTREAPNDGLWRRPEYRKSSLVQAQAGMYQQQSRSTPDENRAKSEGSPGDISTRLRTQKIQQQRPERSVIEAGERLSLLAARILLCCLRADFWSRTSTSVAGGVIFTSGCDDHLLYKVGKASTSDEHDASGSAANSADAISATRSTVSSLQEWKGPRHKRFRAPRRMKRGTSGDPGVRRNYDESMSATTGKNVSKLPRERRRTSSWTGKDSDASRGSRDPHTAAAAVAGAKKTETDASISSSHREASGPPMSPTRRKEQVAVSRELRRLGAAARAIKLLRDDSPLHQELGLLLLAEGLKDEKRLREHESRKRGAAANTASTPKPDGHLQALLVGSGSLQSLCWLLLHSRPDVSAGAARIFSIIHSSSRCDEEKRWCSAEWMLSMVEQGCIPILRMVAGASERVLAQDRQTSKVDAADNKSSVWAKERLAPKDTMAYPQFEKTLNKPQSPREAERLLAKKALLSGDIGSATSPKRGAPPDSPRDIFDEELQVPGAGAESREALTITSARVADRDTRNWAKQTAQILLDAIAQEACTRHLARLVRVISSSANLELRANVAVALVLLSVNGSRSGFGVETRRSLVAGGGLATMIGMLRSPTGRSSGVSFLRVVAALLEKSPVPSDFFADAAQRGESGIEDPTRDPFRKDEGFWDKTKDTVVLVKDRSACLDQGSEKRGGVAEIKGIKMACPPREAMCEASSTLQCLLQESPPGQLPILHGRYRTWDELMAHLGAPHTFLHLSSRYSTSFLIELFVLSGTYEIEDVANGYAWELWRRLQPTVDRDRVCNKEVTTGNKSNSNCHAMNGVGQYAAPTEGNVEYQQPERDNSNDSQSGRSPPCPPPIIGEQPPADSDAAVASAGRFDAFGGNDREMNGVQRKSSDSAPNKDVPHTSDDRAVNLAGRHGAVRSSTPDKPHPRGATACDEGGDEGFDSRRQRASGSHEDALSAPDVCLLLEASLKGRRAWLCSKVFQATATRMRNGDEDWLPAHPRKLTALLDLLRQFLSLLLSSDAEER